MAGERFHRRLIDGARTFPPEDCGGLGGYAQCVDVVRGNEDDEELREWLGDRQVGGRVALTPLGAAAVQDLPHRQ